MIDTIQPQQYKNQTSWYIENAELEEFIFNLEKKEKSDAQIKRARRRLEHCLDELAIIRPDYNYDTISLDDFKRIRDNLSFYSEREIEAHIRIFGTFIEENGGTNHFFECYCLKRRNTDWADGLEGIFIFERELDEYRKYLSDLGCTKDWINSKCNMITKCCSVLYRQKRILRLDAVEQSHLDYLYSVMDRMEHRHATNYVSALSDFVKFSIGRDPLQEYRDSRHRYRLSATPQSDEFRKDLEKYIEDCRERGLKIDTVQNFSLSLSKVYNRLTEIYGPLYPKDIDYHLIRSLKDAFPEKQQTVKKNLQCFGKFTEFSYGHNVFKESGIGFDYEPSKKTFIENEECLKIYENADITGKLIISLAATMGLRRSEIARISLSDINGNEMVIHGKGKGTNGRRWTMEISDDVMECLVHYIPYRQSLIGEVDRSEGRLILRNKTKKGTPIDANAVRYIIDCITEKVCVDASCHTFRRLFAENLFSVMPAENVKEFLRHVFVSTTINHYHRVKPETKKLGKIAVGKALHA